MSHFGVRTDMPEHLQKATMLFNQIMRIFGLVIILASITISIVFHLPTISWLLVGMLPLVAITLFLTLRGKIFVGATLFSIATPIYFLITSIYTKTQGIGIDLGLYFAPRNAILIAALLPAVVFGFKNIRNVIFSILTGVICYSFYDYAHSLFGVSAFQLIQVPKYYIIMIISGGGVFIIPLLITLFLQDISKTYEDRLKAQNTLIEKQKEEIQAQNEYTQSQNQIISKQFNDIKDSIHYAKRIQTAVLPSTNYLQHFLFEHFVLFLPKDIVSGDFFWLKKTKINENECVILVAADCTGHGVPGAFMSILGVTLLNEIVRNTAITKASQLLDELRVQIKMSLQQTGEKGEQQDGMDIAVCIINTQNLQMNFAGAHNPCWIFRAMNNEQLFTINYSLFTLEADRMPVGVFIREKSFTEQNIQLQSGDIFYIFSDGFHSQAGGEKNLPLKSKNFKRILSEICHLPMLEQKQILENEFNKWKGEYSQTDDVLVMAVKV